MIELVFADQATELVAGLERSYGSSRGEQGHPISHPESCRWLSWVAIPQLFALSFQILKRLLELRSSGHSLPTHLLHHSYWYGLNSGKDFCSPSRQWDNEVISTHICVSKHALELLHNSGFQHQLWRRHTQKNPVSAMSKLLAGAKVQNAHIVWKSNTARVYYKELDRFLVLF